MLVQLSDILINSHNDKGAQLGPILFHASTHELFQNAYLKWEF